MSGTINGRDQSRSDKAQGRKKTVAGSVRRNAANPADRPRDAGDPEWRRHGKAPVRP